MKDHVKLLQVPEDLFHMLAADMDGALKPFDVRLLLILLPDLLRSPEPVRINLSYYASLMARTLPQLSRSMTSLVKAGYVVRYARSKISYTYSLNTDFLSTMFGGSDAVRQYVTHRVYGKNLPSASTPDVVAFLAVDHTPKGQL